MAQSKKKRQTKHRGTQAGNVEARGRTSRPRTRAEARQRAEVQRRQRRSSRALQPPTWRGAMTRAGIATVVFMVVVSIVSKNPLQAALVSVLMFGLYVPMGFYVDRFMYRRVVRRRQAEGG